MTIFIGYLLVSFGACLGYIIAALMFAARESDSMERFR